MRNSICDIIKTDNHCIYRKHRKGLEEETTKKRTKKAQKFQRAVVGANLSDILAKRIERGGATKKWTKKTQTAKREQAIR